MRFHPEERPFGCEICDKKFTLSTDLIRHMHFHASERSGTANGGALGACPPEMTSKCDPPEMRLDFDPGNNFKN